MISQLANFFVRISDRERFMVALLLIVVSPIALFVLVFQPLVSLHDDAERQISEAESLRAWYVARQAEIAFLPREIDEESDAQQVTLGELEEILSATGLESYIELLTVNTENQFVLEFGAVPFDQFMRGVVQAVRNSELNIRSINIARGNQLGTVNVDLQLEPR